MKVLVWDIPTRLFHWLFAAAFAVSFITGQAEILFPLHVLSGLLILVLIGYRIVWGLIGSRYARFTSFLFSPGAASAYAFDVMKGKAKRFIGHNPAGSWAIYLLLLLGAGAAMAGLLMLVYGESFEDIHEVLANALLAVVIVHLVGLMVESLVHKESLPKAMINGHKEGAADDGIKSPHYLAATVLLALMVGTGALFLNGYDSAKKTLSLPFLAQPLDLSGEEHEGHKHNGHEHEDD